MNSVLVALFLITFLPAKASAKIPASLFCGDGQMAVQLDLADARKEVLISSENVELARTSVESSKFESDESFATNKVNAVFVLARGAGEIRVQLTYPTLGGRVISGSGSYSGNYATNGFHHFKLCSIDFLVDKNGIIL
jgi:hypothetical protein